MTPAFQKATRKKAKARIALTGPSGSGKTYSALALAAGLGGKVAVIDTERGSASLYSDVFDFDVLELDPPFSPERYVQAIKAAEAAGYDVLVIDSLSHAWSAEGGVLDMVDKESIKIKGNKFAAWAKGTPAHNSLINGVTRAGMHVIATMRSKTEYVLEEVTENGRKISKPRKMGMAPIQREGTEYEFTIWAEIDMDHNLIVTKSRMQGLQDAVIDRPGIQLGKDIREWLEGVPAPTEPAPAEPVKPQLAPAQESQPEAKTIEPEPTPEPESEPDKPQDYWGDIANLAGFPKGLLLKKVRGFPEGKEVLSLDALSPDSPAGKRLLQWVDETSAKARQEMEAVPN